MARPKAWARPGAYPEGVRDDCAAEREATGPSARGHHRRLWNFGTRQQVAIAEWHIVGYDVPVSVWRADRVAEGACLLSEYSPKDYLGFESPALRQTMSAPTRKIAGRRFAFYLPRPPWTRTRSLARIAPHALGRTRLAHTLLMGRAIRAPTLSAPASQDGYPPHKEPGFWMSSTDRCASRVDHL